MGMTVKLVECVECDKLAENEWTNIYFFFNILKVLQVSHRI